MADRPLECTQCKKPIAVDYTEVVDGVEAQLSMCAECPVLQRKLHQSLSEEIVSAKGKPTGVFCGSCNTDLESVRTGNLLGCGQCYDTFADVLTYELISNHRISHRLGKTASKNVPLHIGRSPGQAPTINPSIQLVALDEALEATLKSEDYEGAAWLRDQIKTVKEHIDESREG